MTKIGVTGGIGSGKSVVSSLLCLMGIPVYAADAESKRLSNSSPAIRSGLVSLFGDSIYCGDSLNRPALASIIFNSREALEAVNAIIHPEVRKDFLRWSSKFDLCAIESAILYESGFNADVEAVLMVYAPLELRIKRVAERDGMDLDSITRRINSQTSDEEKKLLADYVIYNDDRQPIIPQLEAALKRLKR